MKLWAGLFVCFVFLNAADWPQFRGPQAAGIGNGAPPFQWDGASGKNVLWKTPIPGLAHSSPVIWGDKIFVTTAVPASGDAALKVGLYGDIQPVKNEGRQAFKVYCLHRKTGKVLWERTAFEGEPKTQRHPKSSHANPTPATDGKHLVVSFGSEGLYNYDLDGKLVWKKDLGVLDAGYFRVPSAQWGYSSSPVIHDGVLIIQADVQKNSFLAAFDVKTGKELWRTARADVPTFGSPAVMPYGGQGATLQVVVNGWKHIGGYDFRTGKQLWKLTGGGDIPVPTPLYDNGLAVVTNAHGGLRPIYVIRNNASGNLDEEKSAIVWKEERMGNYMQTPLLNEGLGYFCYDNGVLSVFQLKTGERLYQQRLGAGSSGFSSSPVAAGGRIYITDETGHTFVLATGAEYRVLAENELGETVMGTPAIVDGVLYVRGGRHLWAIAER